MVFNEILTKIRDFLFSKEMSVGIISGIISGMMIYLVLEYYEKKKWNTSKKFIFAEIDRNINGLLTHSRLYLDIDFPIKKEGKKNIKEINKEIIEFFELEILKKIDNYDKKIKYPEKENLDKFYQNLLDSKKEISNLISRVFLFKKPKPELVTRLYTNMNNVKRLANSLLIFAPEISLRKWDNNQKLAPWRRIMKDDFYKLLINLIQLKKYLCFGGQS